ncbi:MAG: tyrosine--tRNA ligase [Deltaproteobacteria bacterium]|nr:tyrosine--tRNA ligase [Deltaproteobacteria bacterium]
MKRENSSIEEALKRLTCGVVEIIPENGLREKLQQSLRQKRPLRIKAGFDPTAPDLHLGHTILLRCLKNFQDLGHEVHFLIGDFTARIGDPTGRSEIRRPLSIEEIRKNSETYQNQVGRILDIKKVKIVFNGEWMEKMQASDLVKLAAKHTVARMLERDDFSKRHREGSPIHIHEFLYPLIQGYDSVMLKADIELGGTDQRFNLLVGRELQREYGQEPQVVMLFPLLEGTDGVQKMSKSLGNTIGITESAKEIYGKVMSISDELMWRYYSLLTDRSVEEISRWKEEAQAGSVHPRDLKAQLALELTTRFQGKEEALRASQEFDRVFRTKQSPEEIETTPLKWAEETIPVALLLSETGLVSSRSEARRLIQQGGVMVEGHRISDIQEAVSAKGDCQIQVGKRRFRKVRFI